MIGGAGNKGVIGEQEGNTSGLADSNTDRRRLVDEFCSHDGPMHSSESEDKDEVFKEKVQVGTDKEETKVMTRSK